MKLKSTYIMKSLVTILIFCVFLTNCTIFKPAQEEVGITYKEKLMQFNEIKYSFIDSSVSPEYHRSYSITIRKDGHASYTCSSYNDILVEKDFKVSSKKIKNLEQLISGVEGTDKLSTEALSGSSTERINLRISNESDTVNQMWYWVEIFSKPATYPHFTIDALVLEIKDIAEQKVGKLGKAEYITKLDKYIASKKKYQSASNVTDFDKIPVDFFITLDIYLKNENTNIFKKYLWREVYYINDKKTLVNGDVIKVEIVHKNDFKLRIEQEENSKTTDLGLNPTGFNATVTYNTKSNLITNVYVWK